MSCPTYFSILVMLTLRCETNLSCDNLFCTNPAPEIVRVYGRAKTVFLALSRGSRLNNSAFLNWTRVSVSSRQTFAICQAMAPTLRSVGAAAHLTRIVTSNSFAADLIASGSVTSVVRFCYHQIRAAGCRW